MKLHSQVAHSISLVLEHALADQFDLFLSTLRHDLLGASQILDLVCPPSSHFAFLHHYFCSMLDSHYQYASRYFSLHSFRTRTSMGSREGIKIDFQTYLVRIQTQISSGSMVKGIVKFHIHCIFRLKSALSSIGSSMLSCKFLLFRVFC